jgi:hypothetical protein
MRRKVFLMSQVLGQPPEQAQLPLQLLRLLLAMK